MDNGYLPAGTEAFLILTFSILAVSMTVSVHSSLATLLPMTVSKQACQIQLKTTYFIDVLH